MNVIDSKELSMLFSEKRFPLFGSMLRPSICLWTEPCRGSGASGGRSRTNVKLRRAPKKGDDHAGRQQLLSALEPQDRRRRDAGGAAAGRRVVVGLQHVVAMFGATVLASLLMGFD